MTRNCTEDCEGDCVMEVAMIFLVLCVAVLWCKASEKAYNDYRQAMEEMSRYQSDVGEQS